jgi:hypothetical protein
MCFATANNIKFDSSISFNIPPPPPKFHFSTQYAHRSKTTCSQNRFETFNLKFLQRIWRPKLNRTGCKSCDLNSMDARCPRSQPFPPTMRCAFLHVIPKFVLVSDGSICLDDNFFFTLPSSP